MSKPSAGDGTPLLLLHGFTGSSESWRGVIERLPQGLKPVVPALTGHSTGPQQQVRDFEGEIGRLAAHLRSIGFRGGHVCGYSLGARIALGLLSAHPEYFAGATLMGVNPGLESAQARQDRLASDATWIAMLENDGLATFLDAWEAQPLFASQASLPMAVRRAQRTLRENHDPAGLAYSLRVLGLAAMPNYWQSLRSLEQPTTVFSGDLDPKFTRIALEICSRWPAARWVRVPGAGHNLLLEAPERIAAHLARQVGAG